MYTTLAQLQHALGSVLRLQVGLSVHAVVCRSHALHRGGDAQEMTSTTFMPHTLSTCNGATLT